MADNTVTTRIPRQLIESDIHGKGAAEIGWGSPGDFKRCEAFARAHSVPGHMIEGFCANLHKLATGEWPGPNAHKGAHALVLDYLIAAASPPQRVPWWGPLAPINKATGDGRIFPPNVLEYQSFPMAFRWQEKGSRGHEGAVTVATIEGAKEITIDGEPTVWAYGYWLDPNIIPEVTKAQHQVENGVTGPSVDLDSYTAALMDDVMTGKKVASLQKGRMRAATLVNIPAFADLRITTGKPGDSIPHFAVTASIEPDLVHFAVNGDTWRKAPIAPRDALFDADDAVSRIEAWANGDPAKMASAFLWVNTDNGPLLGRQGYRLPWADIFDGQPHLVYHAAYSAAALLQDAHGGLPNIPDGDKMKLRSIISEIYQKLSAEFNDPSLSAPWDRQDAQADGDVEEFGPDPDDEPDDDDDDWREDEQYQAYMASWCDCDCVECQLIDSDTFDAANIEEFLGRYTESKHPRDPRQDKHAGEWVDVPGHGPHGQIKVGGKWVYPPKKGGRGHKRADHQPKHGHPEGTKPRDEKAPYRYQGKRRIEDAEAQQRREDKAKQAPAPKKEAPEKPKAQTRVVKKAPVARKSVPKEPVHKPEPEKKAPVKKAAVAKKAPEPQKPKAKTVAAKQEPAGHKLTPAQQKALESIHEWEAGGRKGPQPKVHGNIVNALDKKGLLIVRVRQEKRGESHHYELTDAGRKHLGVEAPKAKEASGADRDARLRKDIVDHVQGIHDKAGRSWVGMAGLRDALDAKGYSREEQDAALRRMVKDPDLDFRAVPVADVKNLNQRDRDAALRIGVDENNVVQIGAEKRRGERNRRAEEADAKAQKAQVEADREAKNRANLEDLKDRERAKAPGAAKKAPAKRGLKAAFDAPGQWEKFKKLRRRDEASAMVQDLPKRDLVALAKEGKIPHRVGDNAAQIRAALIRWAGAAEDHDAILGGNAARKGAVERAAQGRKAAELPALSEALRARQGVQAAKKVSAKPAAQKQGSDKIDPEKKAAGPRKANGWGGVARADEHYFHSDGAIGVAQRSLGADGAVNVDGDRLDNRLGDIATAVVKGSITPDAGLAEYKKLRDRLPEGSKARGVLDQAIEDMDAPAAKRPASYEGAPAPLRKLWDKLSENPLARGNEQARRGKRDGFRSELDRLDELMQAWHKGELSKIRASRMVREQLFNRHHESNEGKVPLDRDVAEAIREIEAVDRDAWNPKAPAAKAPTGTSAKRMRAANAAEDLKIRRAERDARIKDLDDRAEAIERDIRFRERELKDPANAWKSALLRAEIAKQKAEVQVIQDQVDRLKAAPGDQLGKVAKRESLDPEAEKLGKKYTSGAKDAQRKGIHAGAQGKKERLTLPDGSQLFSKQLNPRGLNAAHDGVAEADSEELASLLGRAFGAPVPVVHRADDTHILMDWVDGKTFGEIHLREQKVAEADPSYKLMGLLDMLTYNTDRHRGNIMAADGKPVAIDNGLAWSKISRAPAAQAVSAQVRQMFNSPPFGPARLWHRFGLHESEAKELKTKLEALRPAFRTRGRETWLDFSLLVVDELAKRPDKKRLR